MKFTSAIVTLSLVLFVSGEPPVPQNNYLPPQNGGGLGNTYLPPSTSYGAPSTNSFRPSARPSSQYGAPSQQYGAPSAPSQQYGTPSAPSQQYGAPSAPSQQYGAPSAPSQKYGAPSQQYGAPSTPSQQYGAPSSSPSAQYGAPAVTGAIFKSQQYSQQQSQGYSYGNANGYSNGGYENNEPARYNFEYAVLDYPSGNDFGHMESRDGDKTVGRYYVLLPDGRKQVVNYEADQNGYRPQISYEQTNNGNGYGNGNNQNGGGDKFNGY